MKTKSTTASNKIVFFAIILALTVVALALPIVFLIPLLFVAVSFNLQTTMIASFIFGLISLALSFVGGAFVPLAFIEQPIIPIIPRLLAGIITFLTHRLATRLIRKNRKIKQYLPKLLAAILGTLANTFFVISFMCIFLPRGFSYEAQTLNAFIPIMIGAGITELIVNAIVLPPLAISVNRALKFTRFRDMLTGDFS